ncbi:unnamed protein product [Polarella glacialis]|uniref:Glycosyl transferase CAP10 domain-containing protein n=1 Tax=Polarella glacialis TaxID=89957 RepID=A0A813F2N0_POLGL|nr:unnamed protein product [Polarella glacialis]
MLYMTACQEPASPLLWSQHCFCCHPWEHQVCGEAVRAKLEEEAGLEQAQCCYPVYARRVLEPPDERLEAQIQSHLQNYWVHQDIIADEGPKLRCTAGADVHGSGCVIDMKDGDVRGCDESHACPDFDCSYMRAFVKTVRTIQRINPLPDVKIVMNAGDLTMDYTGEIPVFTRTGTRWTNTVALPFEWQLDPFQCQSKMMIATRASENAPWERRAAKLSWRGSISNCRIPGCRIAAAADGDAQAWETCGRLQEGQARDCTWNMSTWLKMPRGRLVWLSRFNAAIDAKFVLHPKLKMDEDLEQFLQNEGLIAEHREVRWDAFFKYHIAIDGDSAPDRLYWQLFMGSVVIIQESVWQEIIGVIGPLEPFVHFVPVRYDLSDLSEKVAWLQQNDVEARQIALRGVAFAQQHLTCDGILYYVDRLLRAVAARTQSTSSEA